MNNLENVKVGDWVCVESYVAGVGSWNEAVSELSYKHDRNSGEPYPVIVLANGAEFDATTGNAVTPPTAYYISDIVK